MIILLNFLVLTCESDSCIFQFLNELNLTYQRLTNFTRHSTHSNSIGALGQVFIMSHSYQIYFGFPGSDLNLDCRLRDHATHTQRH